MEKVVERADYPKEKLGEIFGEDTFGMLGYGTQGRGQALNLRDNGMKVIVGVREGGRVGISPRRTDSFPARR